MTRRASLGTIGDDSTMTCVLVHRSVSHCNSTRGLRRRDLVRTYLLRKSFSSYSKVFPHLCVLERDTIRSNIQDVGIHTSRKVVDPNGSVWDRADSRQDTTQDTDVAVAPIRLMC